MEHRETFKQTVKHLVTLNFFYFTLLLQNIRFCERDSPNDTNIEIKCNISLLISVYVSFFFTLKVNKQMLCIYF